MAKSSGTTKYSGSNASSAANTPSSPKPVTSAPNLYSSVGEEFSRRVSLGISTKDASAIKDQEILDSVVGQLSDGIWENSPSMEKFWRTMRFSQDANGNVELRTLNSYKDVKYKYDKYLKKMVSVPNYKWGGFNGLTDKGAKEWIANKIKSIFSNEVKYTGSLGKWSADNTTKMDYLGSSKVPITVGDAYKLWKRLKGS